jgi:hypothetical protein
MNDNERDPMIDNERDHRTTELLTVTRRLILACYEYGTVDEYVTWDRLAAHLRLAGLDELAGLIYDSNLVDAWQWLGKHGDESCCVTCRRMLLDGDGIHGLCTLTYRRCDLDGEDGCDCWVKRDE